MKKILIVLGVIALVVAAKFTGLLDQLSFENLKARQEELRALAGSDPLRFGAAYFGVYVFATALSLPGAAILTLGAGAIFGFTKGLILVSFASSLGATLAFLVSRHLLRSTIKRKFSSRVKKIDRGIEKEGAFYLFTLRLVPAFPFFLINAAMGLTSMSVLTFYWVSQLGMLVGTAVYVNAGTQLGSLESPSGILTPRLIGSFVLLGILPLITKRLIDAFKGRKAFRGFKKPKSYDYNLVAIGAGSAGLVTSYIGAVLKARVALVEKHKMGGDCLNTGCVPSKTLIKSSRIAHDLRRAKEFGLVGNDPQVDFSQVMKRVHGVIKEIAPHDSVERYEGLGVECFLGEAEIVSPWEVVVNGKSLTTKNIVLATGASPFLPPLPGLKDVNPKTSENLWELTTLPKNLLVLGGGAIGCELSQAFARLGSKVTLVEAGERILSKEDSEVSELLERVFEKENILVLKNHRAVEFRNNDEKKAAVLETPRGKVEVFFDEVIVALGRRANTGIKGMERLKLNLSESGTFEHDEFLRTRFPNIFVCGDCAGPYQFTHTASHQAWYAAVNALFSPFKKFNVDYRVIPWTTFTDPEVARVGISEEEARKNETEYEVTRYELSDLDRALTEGEARGFVKVITPKGSDEILGATIVGHNAGEILSEMTLAMRHNLGLKKILSTIHTYPTMSEASKYAAGVWGRAHKPERLLNLVKAFHSWRRG